MRVGGLAGKQGVEGGRAQRGEGMRAEGVEGRGPGSRHWVFTEVLQGNMQQMQGWQRDMQMKGESLRYS